MMRDATSSSNAPSSAGTGAVTSSAARDPSGRSELAALYLRVAETLERSADLAEQHAQREQQNGRWDSASTELGRAGRARDAARRGRALASRLT
jgi:hypothetical protein